MKTETKSDPIHARQAIVTRYLCHTNTKIANKDITAAYIRANAKPNAYGITAWVCVCSLTQARKWAKRVKGCANACMGSGPATVFEIAPDTTSIDFEARRLAYHESIRVNS